MSVHARYVCVVARQMQGSQLTTIAPNTTRYTLQYDSICEVHVRLGTQSRVIIVKEPRIRWRETFCLLSLWSVFWESTTNELVTFEYVHNV